jgi:flagellin
MGFRINTNVMALTSNTMAAENNRNISSSLEKLSSGLRINKAADDASGMAIANSLRSQANSLGQAIKNANDGIGIMQTADKAIDEQSKILDTIKTKATQAAQDGQTEDTRKAIQKDITKLMEELDNIAETTSFNGQSLLSGQYTDKKFQIGASSNETISLDIGATSSDKIGHVRFETGRTISAASEVSLTFKDVDGMNDVDIESTIISHSAGTGIGVLAETINKNSEQLGIKASWNVVTTGDTTVANTGTSDITDLQINGIQIGTVSAVEANDRDGRLINAINEQTDKTGVIASIDERGHLELKSTDGRGISLSGNTADTISKIGIHTYDVNNYGRLTLIKMDGTDIHITGVGVGVLSKVGMSTMSKTASKGSEATINLRDIKRGFSIQEADAMGMFTSRFDVKYTKAVDVEAAIGSTISDNTPAVGAGVTTLEGAMAVMSIAESSMKNLDSIRSEIGSTQNQMVSTINNISVTQVNLKASESQIRDVDFAQESANFQKSNLLAQAGSYVAGQANAQQMGILQLLS